MSYLHNKPSIDITMVGFGQAGTRIVDRLASFKDLDNQPIYNTLALNSNDGDLEELSHVPKENRISLKLGGLGKNPIKAMSILEEDQSAKTTLQDFICNKVRPTDELVIFFAGLGGGTGTSTIVKAMEEFHQYFNMRLVKEETQKILAQVGPQEFKDNQKKYVNEAFRKVQPKFKKIGIVATIPVRSDGPDVLRQVNEFAIRIRKASMDPTKSIAFTWFPDNQAFYDAFVENRSMLKEKTYRDYANKEIADAIHELNTATNGSGTSVIFDSKDFRRVMLEHQGNLCINSIEIPRQEITNSTDLVRLFMKSMNTNRFHAPIAFQETNELGTLEQKKVHHVGLLAIIPPELKELGSSFLDDAKNEIANQIPINGTIFNGYLIERNNFKVTVYTIYKTEALPSRLSNGLLKEYDEFMSKQKEIKYAVEEIKEIAATSEDEFDIDISLEDLGIEIEIPDTNEKSDDDIIDLENINYDELLK